MENDWLFLVVGWKAGNRSQHWKNWLRFGEIFLHISHLHPFFFTARGLGFLVQSAKVSTIFLALLTFTKGFLCPFRKAWRWWPRKDHKTFMLPSSISCSGSFKYWVIQLFYCLSSFCPHAMHFLALTWSWGTWQKSDSFDSWVLTDQHCVAWAMAHHRAARWLLQVTKPPIKTQTSTKEEKRQERKA